MAGEEVRAFRRVIRARDREFVYRTSYHTLFYTIVHSLTLCYTILHDDTLFYNIVHFFTLFYTILHYCTLFYTVIFSLSEGN